MFVSRVALTVILIFGIVIALDQNSSIFQVVSYAWAGFSQFRSADALQPVFGVVPISKVLFCRHARRRCDDLSSGIFSSNSSEEFLQCTNCCLDLFSLLSRSSSFRFLTEEPSKGSYRRVRHTYMEADVGRLPSSSIGCMRGMRKGVIPPLLGHLCFQDRGVCAGSSARGLFHICMHVPCPPSLSCCYNARCFLAATVKEWVIKKRSQSEKSRPKKKFFFEKSLRHTVFEREQIRKEIPVQISKMMPKTIDTPGSV